MLASYTSFTLQSNTYIYYMCASLDKNVNGFHLYLFYHPKSGKHKVKKHCCLLSKFEMCV